MRIGARALGNLAQYEGPSPVTLIDGTVIQNPGTQAATDSQCVPYRCGADPENLAARMWCGFWGRGGNTPCQAECLPYEKYGANLCATQVVQPPQPSTALQNSRVSKAVTKAVPKHLPARLTPQNIVQAMPDITQALQPVAVPVCSDWAQLNGWIQENPILSAGILAGAFWLLWRNRRG